jgi:hypothetical protein
MPIFIDLLGLLIKLVYAGLIMTLSLLCKLVSYLI